MRKEQNPWSYMLGNLKRHASSTTPRQLAAWQLYMGNKADHVQEAFAVRWPASGLDRDFSLAFRGQVARDLLKEESDEYREELKAECKRLHEEDLAKYDNLAEVPAALKEEVSREQCVYLPSSL